MISTRQEPRDDIDPQADPQIDLDPLGKRSLSFFVGRMVNFFFTGVGGAGPLPLSINDRFTSRVALTLRVSSSLSSAS